MSDDQKSAQNLRAAAEEFRLWDVWDMESWPARAYIAIHTVSDRLDAAADRIEALEAEVERLRENTGAVRLLEWISYHHLPLQLWREDDGQWVVVDGSTNHVLGSGEDAETAIRAALSADKTKEE